MGILLHFLICNTPHLRYAAFCIKKALPVAPMLTDKPTDGQRLSRWSMTQRVTTQRRVRDSMGGTASLEDQHDVLWISQDLPRTFCPRHFAVNILSSTCCRTHLLPTCYGPSPPRKVRGDLNITKILYGGVYSGRRRAHIFDMTSTRRHIFKNLFQQCCPNISWHV